MRRKKHKQTRRAVNFFKVNYGFHEPYKVLLDGNFIHATAALNMGNLDTHVPRLLGGTSKLYTTRCISKELRGMGDDFRATAAAARGFLLHKCDHATPVAAAQCIKEQIGARNGAHWFVATQDQALRQELGKVPGCPIVFATVNGVHLETPSELTRQLIQQVEEQQQTLQRHERRSEALKGLEELRVKPTTSVRFRRVKAKGPNPLASKKKIAKKKKQQPGGSGNGSGSKERPKPARQQGEGQQRQQQRPAQQQEQAGPDAKLRRRRKARTAGAAAAAGGGAGPE